MRDLIGSYLPVLCVFVIYIWGTKKYLSQNIELDIPENLYEAAHVSTVGFKVAETKERLIEGLANYTKRLDELNKGLWLVSSIISTSQLCTLIFLKAYVDQVQPANLKAGLIISVSIFILIAMLIAKRVIGNRENYWKWTKYYFIALYIAPLAIFLIGDKLKRQIKESKLSR